MKVLPAMTVAEQRKQFDRELKAHLVAQDGADRVCRVLGTCTVSIAGGRRSCLVMKRYVRSLKDVLAAAGGPLDGGTVRRYGRALGQTLQQLHTAGVVVQDIKPENILLDEWDAPVLAVRRPAIYATSRATFVPAQRPLPTNSIIAGL